VSAAPPGPEGGSPAGAAPNGGHPSQGGGQRPRRERPQEARLTPEAIAEARGDAREGLDWLGREPETKASLLYRSLRLLARAVFFGVFRFRVETSGQEHVPGGGYLLVAAVHRGWMDPFLVQHALPVEPRAWFLGSAPTAFSSRWREWLLHRVGGMLPVWRGGVGIDVHVASAEAVLRAGGVFVIMAEGGIPGPPDRLAPFRSGSALIAIRTRAPIVPLAMVGSKELYIGRRMATRVLAPTSAEALLGAALGDPGPEPGSREELDLAHELTERLAAMLGPVVTELYPGTVDPPVRPRRFRGLTWLFIARPKASRDGQDVP